MSTDRSDAVYGYWLESSQKFDYFVVGIAVALVSYLGARLNLDVLGWNPPTIELVATLTLLLATIAGLKRIESNVTVLRIMHRRLYEEEAAGSMAAVATGGSVVNQSTGEILSSLDLLGRVHRHKQGAQAAHMTLEKIADRCGLWYRVRNATLILGLLTLIASRVLNAFT